ncbi:glycosyltransferase [Desulfofustis glycolicus]|nr:glycosyltransferase [Desulfofustis glycolicus]
MKIFHVIDSGGFYGAEVVLLYLMEAQLELGLEPTLISIGLPGEKEKAIEIEARRCALSVEQFRMRPGPNWLGAYSILNTLWREGAQILHSHGYKSNILFGLIPRKIRKIPMVTTLHGWTTTTQISKIRVYEWLDSLSLRFVDQVAIVNKEMFKHPKLAPFRDKFKVIDNGIPLTDDCTHDLNEKVVSFCKNGQTLCAIGRLSREKGFDLLIKALPKVLAISPDTRLIIIGEGSHRQQLQDLIGQLNLNDKVMMPGYLPYAYSYLKYCQGLVMSSLTEGLPITLLEAMRIGAPIIATRVGGIPEVLASGDCGILVEKNSVSEIERGILQFISEMDESRLLGQKAKMRFEKNYNNILMARRYMELYCSVLGSM